MYIYIYIYNCNNAVLGDEFGRQFSITRRDKAIFPFATTPNIRYIPTGFQCWSYR